MRKPNFERLLKVLMLEEPDRVPFYELFVDQEVMETILGVKFRIDPSKDETVREYCRRLVEFYRKLGYDYVPFSAPLNLPRSNILMAKDTAVYSRGFRSWQNEHRGEIETIEDYYEYQWPEKGHEILPIGLETFNELRKIVPEDMKILAGAGGGVLENVMWLMGTVPFAKAIYREPKLIEMMFNSVGSIIESVDKYLAEFDEVGGIVMGDDMGYKRGTFIKIEHMRKYVFPWQKKCVEAAHRRGLPFILHACGNLESIMEDLINYVGIDAKHSYEDETMPVIKAKIKYGDRIAILGGIDVDKLTRFSVKDIEEYTLETLKKCALGGGYALGSGNTIANYVKVENYLAMLKVGEKYGVYTQTF